MNSNFKETRRAIGAYSLNLDDRTYSKGLKNLGYVRTVNDPSIDLMEGEYEEKKSYDSYERLNQMTGFLKDNIKDGYENVIYALETANVVCSAGLLKIVMTSKIIKDPWTIHAFKHKNNNTIFLSIKKKTKPLTEEQKLIAQLGIKFENYVLAADAKCDSPGKNEKVIENEEFFIVYKNKFGSNNVMYASEIDGVESEETITSFDQLMQKILVEVKLTSRKNFRLMEKVTPKNNEQYMKYKFQKLVEWWSSAYLAGITKFVVGLRNDEKSSFSQVKEIVEITSEKLFSNIPAETRKELIEFLEIKLDFICKKATKQFRIWDKKGETEAFCCFEYNAEKDNIKFEKGTLTDEMKKEHVFLRNICDIYERNL